MTSNNVDRTRLAGLLADERRRFVATHPASEALHRDAHRSLLGGVPMPWMNRWAGQFPVFFDTAEGARCTDVDGIEYVDFCLGDTGAMTGHALAEVTQALDHQSRRGVTTMLPNEDAAWVGDELTRRFGLPIWQMAMTATDANRFVLRLARHITGRPKVVVMDWCYHGTVDEALVVLSPDGSVIARPGSMGPQVDPALTTKVVQFNDVDGLAAALADGDVACVLMEPALTNIGIVLPRPGYLARVRDLTEQTGTLLVIDETHTICCGPGGATREWGLAPDFVVVGKTIGGGVPAAAYGMTASIAAELSDSIATHDVDTSGIGGTLTGNALAMAAVRATLSTRLGESDFRHSVALATAWTEGVAEVIAEHDVDWHVQQLGCRAEYWFSPPPVTGAQAAAAIDAELEAFMHLWALNRGILLTPFHNMALMSHGHTIGDVERHTDVFREAVVALTRGTDASMS